VKVHFTDRGWADYQHWAGADRSMAEKVNRLIEDARRSPFSGLGKPEPLKGDLAGWWSRRITGEHRLMYRAAGNGPEQRIEIAVCRYHHGNQ
jgi:toxin YoeB